VPLEEEPWRVGKFVRSARGIIESIHARQKVPVLVGGTHYYTQSLLFNDNLVEDSTEAEEAIKEDSEDTWPILKDSTPVILAKLREVDPVMADRWHPQDRRKIQRSLEIWLKTGKRASDVYEEKQQLSKTNKQEAEDPVSKEDEEATERSASPRTPGLRFPTLFLWVNTPPDSLKPRLNRRVDDMITAGLLDEVLSLSRFLETQIAQNRPVDLTRGIWVSIGYKEFTAYCDALKSSARPKTTEKLKDEGVERTKIATRQYAKHQVKWIRSKLLSSLREHGALGRVFVLDSSREWEPEVLAPAVRLAAAFLAGERLPEASEVCGVEAGELLRADHEDLSRRRDLWERRTCEFCGVTAVTRAEWDMHTQGRRHRMTVKAKTQRKTSPRRVRSSQAREGESPPLPPSE